MVGNLNSCSKGAREAMGFTGSLACHGPAYNPAPAGSLVQIQPPQPILSQLRCPIAFTSSAISVELPASRRADQPPRRRVARRGARCPAGLQGTLVLVSSEGKFYIGLSNDTHNRV